MTKKNMHKSIFSNESQFNNCLLESSQLENPSVALTVVALEIGIVSTCEETTREVLPIVTKALFMRFPEKLLLPNIELLNPSQLTISLNLGSP